MKVEIDLPIEDGYSYTGEFRKPRDGELYLHPLVGFCHCDGDDVDRCHILKKSNEIEDKDLVGALCTESNEIFEVTLHVPETYLEPFRDWQGNRYIKPVPLSAKQLWIYLKKAQELEL